MTIALFIVAGLLVGQFLVWCADRLPLERSLLSASDCPACGGSLAAGRPLERWVVALGWRRCEAEGMRLRLRSIVMILVTAAGFGYLGARIGFTMPALPLSLYWAIFVLITVIDLEHRLILNVVIFPAILLAIAGSFVTPDPGIRRALLGGVTGFVFVYLIYLLGALFARLMARRRGRPIDEVAFGAGDVKLAAFIGIVTGLPGVVFALVIGILTGGVAAAAYLGWQVFVRRHYVAFAAIPYGPFLVAGALVMMLYGPQILNWYLSAYR